MARQPCCLTAHTHATPTPEGCSECAPESPPSPRLAAVRAALATQVPNALSRAWYSGEMLAQAESALLPLRGAWYGEPKGRYCFRDMKLARAVELPAPPPDPNATFRNDEARWLLSFTTPEGHMVVWFTGESAAWPEDGWEGDLVATVKEHSVWQNQRQTIISRCKSHPRGEPSKHPCAPAV